MSSVCERTKFKMFPIFIKPILSISRFHHYQLTRSFPRPCQQHLTVPVLEQTRKFPEVYNNFPEFLILQSVTPSIIMSSAKPPVKKTPRKGKAPAAAEDQLSDADEQSNVMSILVNQKKLLTDKNKKKDKVRFL